MSQLTMSQHNKSRRTKPRQQLERGRPAAKADHDSHPGGFTWFAHEVSRLAGRPGTFLLATGVVLAWAVSGPLFHFSDTWQLVINTGTTIVTFLMVFLIQNTQNRDTLALQVKLDELIVAVRGADNHVAAAEDLSDADLEALHAAYRTRADEMCETLARRRDRS